MILYDFVQTLMPFGVWNLGVWILFFFDFGFLFLKFRDFGVCIFEFWILDLGFGVLEFRVSGHPQKIEP